MSVIGVDISKYEVHDIRDNNGNVTSIVSYWNPDNATKEIDFVIQRVSYGGKADEYLDLMYSQALKIPIRGAYHYFSTGVKWQDQAANFLSCVKDKLYNFYMIDYETAYNNLNGTSMAEMFELVKYIANTTGKKVLVYFNPNVYNTYLKPFNADAVINNYDIALAQYPYTASLNLDKAPILSPIKKILFWQYGAADVALVPGYNDGLAYGSWRHGIDLDVFMGTLDDLKTWCGATDVPQPPQPPIVTPPTPKLKITVNDDFSVLTEKL